MTHGESPLGHELFMDPITARGRKVLGDDMTAGADATGAVLLARMDVRTDNMEKTLVRIENTNNERFNQLERESSEQAKKIADLEAWKNKMLGAGIEEQPQRMDNLEGWRNRIVGMTLITMPFVTVLSGFAGAWLSKHVP